ncbi:MAG: hypothetical protein Q7S12_04410 [bacterium]|nr:hypothetical protein [bacterium]
MNWFYTVGEDEKYIKYKLKNGAKLFSFVYFIGFIAGIVFGLNTDDPAKHAILIFLMNWIFIGMVLSFLGGWDAFIYQLKNQWNDKEIIRRGGLRGYFTSRDYEIWIEK